jgi:hypothetical protein
LLAFDQPAGHGLRHEIGSTYVDRHDRVEIIDRDLNEGPWTIGPGIVEQNAERRRRGNGLAHGANVGDVEQENVGRLTSSSDRGCGCLELGSRARGEGDMRAGLGKGEGGSTANTAPGTGDERALAIETKGGRGNDLHGYSAAAA